MKRTAVFCLAALLLGCSEPKQTREQPNQTARKSAPVRITHFYASPTEMERGDRVLLCYGLENAASVSMDPPIETLTVSPNRCVEAKPERNTSYALTAKGADGGTATGTVEVKVVPRSRAAAPAEGGSGMITTFVATATEVGAGQPVTICYETSGADSVRLDPSPQPVTAGKQCVSVRPDTTTTYTLSASGGGRRESRKITVKVR